MAMASRTFHEFLEVCILLQVQHNQDVSLLHLQHGASEGSHTLHQISAKMKRYDPATACLWLLYSEKMAEQGEINLGLI